MTAGPSDSDAARPSDPKLRVEGLTKEYGDLVAVEDVSLSVEEGELVCLLGPSGCGKSTTLRMIAGLEEPTRGRVYVDGEDVTDEPAYRRSTATVFQSWALFPHKTVLENVAFGLKMAGVGRAERTERAIELLETVRMAEYGDSSPAELSGGQKQRVALSRALAVDPEILLLDEPLSNLDKKLREEMQIEINDIQDEFDKATVYVTHDQTEAFTLADRLLIMDAGRIVQAGDPQSVYENPANEFVESFLGETNFLAGEVSAREDGVVTVETALGTAVTFGPVDADGLDPGTPVTVSLRPEDVTLRDASTGSSDADGGVALRGTIGDVLNRGATTRYYVDVGDCQLFTDVEAAEARDRRPGGDVVVTFDQSSLRLFAGGEKVARA